MGLLKKVNIHGEIFSDYVFLTYELCFAETDAHTRAEYIFTLPKRAVVSDVKIICTDGRRIETSVISATHAARLSDVATTAILRRIDATTYSVSIGDLGTGVKVLRLKAYAQLELAIGEKRLMLPLSARLGGAERSDALAKISLILRGAEENGIMYESPTHRIGASGFGNDIEIETEEIPADRDFCLRIKGGEKRNSVIVSRGNFGGELLCVIYPDEDFKNRILQKFKKTLFIFDATGSLLYGADLAARELLCAMAEETDGEFAVLVAGERATMITDGFCNASPENISKLIESAAGIRVAGGSLSETLACAGALMGEDTQAILISGTELSEGRIATDAAKDVFEKGRLSVLTLGATSRGEDINALTEICGGKREHIYGYDNIKLRAKMILNNFKARTIEQAEVCTESGEAYLIDASEERITIFAKYSGEVIPKKFFIKQGGEEQTAFAENISVYQSFAPIGLAYGTMMCSWLEQRLRDCRADDVWRIKEQMEKIGIKYSVLNSETALAAVLSGQRPVTMRVCIGAGGCNSYEAFAEKNFVFGETNSGNITKRQERELVGAYLDIIIKSMRSDGAICADGEINQELRRQQTLVALLTLSALGLLEEYHNFAEKAIEYLGDFGFSELNFTYDKSEAARMLKRLWGDGATVRMSGVPDLLTACRCLLALK